MPTVNSGDKVLVTGANGYIAMWTVRYLLERGYAVRATVRDEVKVPFMKNYFTSLGYGDKLEFSIVPDITVEGAFDNAVKDVDAIAHMASPFHGNVKEPEDFIKPAVQGTVGILKSALKNGSKVKRIVVTSSCAAVMSPPPQPTVFSEADWNEISPKEVEEHGNKTPPFTIYRASKTLAERGAWEFYEKHKHEVEWDISVINPPFVWGPPIHEIKSVSTLNTSLQMWYDNVVVGALKTKEELAASNSWVDVRDTALAHVLALEKKEAGGERIITSEGGYIWQEWLDIANSISPNPLPSHELPKGIPGILTEGPKVIHISYDTSKGERILGLKYHSKLETTKDTLEDFARRGW